MATPRAGNESNDYGEETEATQRRRQPSHILRDVVSQAQASEATRGDTTTGSRRHGTVA
jgi:hypothetical protein